MIQHRPPDDPEAPARDPDAPELSAEPAQVGEDSAEPGTSGSGEGYTVHLDDFDGPLDLLLYLIQRDEMDIYDIQIARITKQYLDYIELLDVFNLDNAGEFLVMASTLMRIKARMLLPIQRTGDEEEDDVDPRDELVRRLLEYKKYKEASEKLARQEEERLRWFTRGSDYPYADEDSEPPELSLSLFDLIRAVKHVLDEMQGDTAHHVYTDIYTVETQESRILEKLETRARLRFEDVFGEMKVKMEVVVTFIALLDLMKAQRITVQQVGAYGELWIVGREPDPRGESLENEAPAAGAATEDEPDAT